MSLINKWKNLGWYPDNVVLKNNENIEKNLLKFIKFISISL